MESRKPSLWEWWSGSNGTLARLLVTCVGIGAAAVGFVYVGIAIVLVSVIASIATDLMDRRRKPLRPHLAKASSGKHRKK